MAVVSKGARINYIPLTGNDMPESSIGSSGGNNLLSNRDSRENMTESGGKIDCSLPENQNNPVCNITGTTLILAIIICIIIAIIIYSVIIFAAMKTKNQNLKIFLIVSIFLPFLAPIGLIIALLIITNAI